MAIVLLGSAVMELACLPYGLVIRRMLAIRGKVSSGCQAAKCSSGCSFVMEACYRLGFEDSHLSSFFSEKEVRPFGRNFFVRAA